MNQIKTIDSFYDYTHRTNLVLYKHTPSTIMITTHTPIATIRMILMIALPLSQLCVLEGLSEGFVKAEKHLISLKYFKGDLSTQFEHKNF